jgi:hypothetical protein
MVEFWLIQDDERRQAADAQCAGTRERYVVRRQWLRGLLPPPLRHTHHTQQTHHTEPEKFHPSKKSKSTLKQQRKISGAA